MPRKSKPRGNCYVTCEALFHLLGGKAAGYVPHRLRHEGDTHWYLVRRLFRVSGTQELIIDPTASQFKTLPDYSQGRGAGFMTKRPSKRAREMMDRMVWQ